MNVPNETFLVCDTHDPQCIATADNIKSAGFSLRIGYIQEYTQLDFQYPRLYAGQYTFEGFDRINEFAGSCINIPSPDQ